MKSALRFFLILLLCGLCSFPAFSQDKTTALSATERWASTIGEQYWIQPDITYGVANHSTLKLDVWQRKDEKTAVPTLIYYHGGGWIFGDRTGATLLFLPYLEMGWNVINVEYRMANVSLAPAAVEDCRCALRWAVRNAKQYNIRVDKYFDKDRIYGLFYRNTINSGAPAVRPAFNTTNDDYIFSIQGNETHTFTTNTLNEAFIGYNRIEGANSQTGLFTVPIVSVTNLGVGWGVGFAQGTYIQHSDHWRDVLTHIRGGHSFKFGYEGWHGDDLAYFAGAIGQPDIHFNSLIDLINNNPYEENNLSYDPVR